MCSLYSPSWSRSPGRLACCQLVFRWCRQTRLDSHFILHGLVSVKPTLPVVAPPTQVPETLPVGHTARAARMHCSHRPLEMLMVAPASVVFSVNSAVPDWPVVAAGLPPHLVMLPAIPPQMASSATF